MILWINLNLQEQNQINGYPQKKNEKKKLTIKKMIPFEGDKNIICVECNSYIFDKICQTHYIK